MDDGRTHWDGCYEHHFGCARARIDTLRAENEALRERAERAEAEVRRLSEWADEAVRRCALKGGSCVAAETRDALRAERDELLRDKARLDWLEELDPDELTHGDELLWSVGVVRGVVLEDDSLRRLIDAAMAEESPADRAGVR